MLFASGYHTQGMFARHLKVYNEGHRNVVNEKGKQCRDRGIVGEFFRNGMGTGECDWLDCRGERGRGLVMPCSGMGTIRDRGCGELLVRVRRVDVRCDAVVRMRSYGVRHGCDGKGDGPSTISSSELL